MWPHSFSIWRTPGRPLMRRLWLRPTSVWARGESWRGRLGWCLMVCWRRLEGQKNFQIEAEGDGALED